MYTFTIKRLVFGVIATMLLACNSQENQEINADPTPEKVLVFTKTEGFRHASIADGILALEKLASENDFSLTQTEDATNFNVDSLSQYAAVVFLSTTGNVLNQAQQTAFEQYIQAGGGFMGIHAATDTEYDWPWYNQLVGAQFLNHPAVQNADFLVVNTNHPATSFFTQTVWNRRDELYNFQNFNEDVIVLLTVDEDSYQGGTNGDNHPMAWYHNFDGGRAFYTAGGHTTDSYTEDLFVQHLLGGLLYAMGR